jgi:uncharacterized DUF497 family protein
MLSFEWDDAKAASNLAKHRVSFIAACQVFNDPLAVDTLARSMDYGEIRRGLLPWATVFF